jgi:6-phosphofructokinase 1
VRGKKKIGILTGGGDVPPLNAVIASAREASLENGAELIGFMHGWSGLVENRYVELSKISVDPQVGGTILKSSRINLRRVPSDVEMAQKNFRKLCLDSLIVIGGEDTLSNSFSLPDIPQVLISKTIDNDVGAIRSNEIVNYFTLGFPTAARKISSLVSLKEGLRTTAYSHERIMIVESMGMHAGWLALSSSLGHPDIIIIPEFPLEYGKFLEKVLQQYHSKKNLIAVVAEGAKFTNGLHISADENEKDDFGHPRFRGSAEILVKKLKKDLKKHFDPRNVNAVNPSYLYRSGPPCDLDMKWANRLGKETIRLITEGLKEAVFLAIQKEKRGFSLVSYPLKGMNGIEDFHRFVDLRFYDPESYSVTKRGIKYLAEIAPVVPEENYGLRP